MAAQYDSESKGERNLAFKPVGPSTCCQAALLTCSRQCRRHSLQRLQDINLLALSCSFHISQHASVPCSA